jgi:hypothetical protein
MGQYFVIKSAMDKGSLPPVDFVLTAGASPEDMLTMEPQIALATQAGSATQLWQFASDGCIASSANPGYIIQAPAAGGPISLAKRLPETSDYQVWSLISLQAFDGPGAGPTLSAPTVDDRCVISVAAVPSDGLVVQGSLTAGDSVWSALLTGEPGDLWWIEPFLGPTDQPTTLRSAFAASSDSSPTRGGILTLKAETQQVDGVELVLGPTSSDVVVGSRVGEGALSTWQLTTDGCLVNIWNVEDLYLTAATLSGNAGVPVAGAPVYAYRPLTTNAEIPGGPQRTGDPVACQQWLVAEPGVLVSAADPALALTSPSALDEQVTLTSYTPGSPLPQQRWGFFSGVALQTLMVQPPIPFPVWTPNQQAVYDFIAGLLWPNVEVSVGGGGGTSMQIGQPAGGLRGQYANLAAPLAAYQARLLALPLPSTVPPGWTPPEDGTPSLQADWDAVVAQLSIELTASAAVQALFAQLQTLWLALGDEREDALNDIAAMLAVAADTQVPARHAKWWELGMGLLYTALNVVGALAGDPALGTELGAVGKVVKRAAHYGLPVIANGLETAVNTTTTHNTQATGPSKELQSYARLQQSLLESFEQLGATLGFMASAVLMDWRKLQVFYAMTCDTSSDASMYWPSTLTSTSARDLLPGYLTVVLQTLTPVAPGIGIYGQAFLAQDASTPPVGLSAQPASGKTLNTYVAPVAEFQVQDEAPQKYVNIYTMLNTSNSKSFTPFSNPEVMDYILGSGAVPLNVFAGSGGWQIPDGNLGVIKGNLSIVENHTSDDIIINYSSGTYGDSSQALPPYSTALQWVGAGWSAANLTLIRVQDQTEIATWWVPGPGTHQDAPNVTNPTYSIASPGAWETPLYAWVLAYYVTYAT